MGNSGLVPRGGWNAEKTLRIDSGGGRVGFRAQRADRQCAREEDLRDHRCRQDRSAHLPVINGKHANLLLAQILDRLVASSWLPWISVNHLHGIAGLEDFDKALFQQSVRTLAAGTNPARQIG